MIIVLGTFEVDAGDRQRFLDEKAPQVAATRAEVGCVDYAFAPMPATPDGCAWSSGGSRWPTSRPTWPPCGPPRRRSGPGWRRGRWASRSGGAGGAAAVGLSGAADRRRPGAAGPCGRCRPSSSCAGWPRDCGTTGPSGRCSTGPWPTTPTRCSGSTRGPGPGPGPSASCADGPRTGRGPGRPGRGTGRPGGVPAAQLGGGRRHLLRRRLPRCGGGARRPLLRSEGGGVHPPSDRGAHPGDGGVVRTHRLPRRAGPHGRRARGRDHRRRGRRLPSAARGNGGLRRAGGGGDTPRRPRAVPAGSAADRRLHLGHHLGSEGCRPHPPHHRRRGPPARCHATPPAAATPSPGRRSATPWACWARC